MAYNAAGATWESRPPGTFANGETITGTPADDAIIGTPQVDVLIGLAGDDQFTVQGADHVNGGDGFDTLILPGLPTDYDIRWQGDLIIASGSIGQVSMFDIDGILFADLPGRMTLPERAN